MKFLLLLALLLAIALSQPPRVKSVGDDDVEEKLEEIILQAIPAAVKSALVQGHVYMRNHSYVLAKIARLIAGGSEKLVVLSDFDHTMSRAYDEKGERCWPTHNVFTYAPGMPEMVATMQNLSNYYRPIEFKKNMTNEEKTPYMVEWWTLSHEAIVKENITKSLLEKLVLDSNIRLRDRADSLIAHLEASRVPLVVFSGGIGDIISIFLTQRLGAIPSNMKIIGNRIIYDDNDVISGFHEPLIHTFNKNGKAINKNQPKFFAEMKKRNNVLLMGDSQGDNQMDVGVCEHYEEGTLKIGFLNAKLQKEDLLPEYLKLYDIVLKNDQSMDIPRLIIDAITKSL